MMTIINVDLNMFVRMSYFGSRAVKVVVVASMMAEKINRVQYNIQLLVSLLCGLKGTQ